MSLTVDAAIAVYVKLRGKKSEIEAENKARVGEINNNLLKIETWLKRKAEEQGVSSFRSPHGTAFLSTTDFAGVEDWNALVEYVKANDAYDMLPKNVNKLAVRAYLDETKELPPGVKYGTKVEIQVRKPSKKVED